LAFEGRFCTLSEASVRIFCGNDALEEPLGSLEETAGAVWKANVVLDCETDVLAEAAGTL
jgi:hypothetical protein